MTVQVQCPGCGKSYNVQDERMGVKARCRNCNARFTLSNSIDETGESADSIGKPDIPGSRGTQPLKSSSSKSNTPHSESGDSTKQDGTDLPERLGVFTIERQLGSGGMGVVYLAHDSILDRKVAIKVLPNALSHDEKRLKRFLREARLAAKLNHVNTATVYQAVSEAGVTYIAMEYVEGESLDWAVSKDSPMDWREATRAIRDAAMGLAAAHELGLVHRDVKPGNLMRTHNGLTKVVDFGLARGRDVDTQLTREGAVLGTPAFMAPEQWEGKETDGRSDLYSLMCTFYYLLTGQLPFDSPVLEVLAHQHHHQDFPDPREDIPGLPEAVCRILTRGGQKSPSERFQNAEELIAELDSLLLLGDESLDPGSSWANLDALNVVSPPQFTKSQSNEQQLPASRLIHRLPRWAWILVACGVVAIPLSLGIIVKFSSEDDAQTKLPEGTASTVSGSMRAGRSASTTSSDDVPQQSTGNAHNAADRTRELERNAELLFAEPNNAKELPDRPVTSNPVSPEMTPSVGSHATETSQRDWWIRDATIKKESFLWVIGVGISSSKTDRFLNMDAEAWESADGGAEVIFGISTSNSDECGLSLVASGNDIELILQKTAIRLKGETAWVRLAEYIKLDSELSGFTIVRCSRCNSLLHGISRQCENCGASF